VTTEKPTPIVVTYEEFVSLCRRLAEKVRAVEFDAYVLLANGGLTPTAYLTKMLEPVLGKKPVFVITMSNYGSDGTHLDKPVILECPAEPIFTGKRFLLVDDVWDTGNSLHLSKKIIERAGGKVIVATLHFKPSKNLHPGEEPDFCVEATADWIQYPWEDPSLPLTP
jgi:hypoxanthine phosphoribosyltransferase